MNYFDYRGFDSLVVMDLGDLFTVRVTLQDLWASGLWLMWSFHSWTTG